MIDPKELMIGNWFTVGESKPFQITGIFKEYIWALIQETDFPIKDLKPIPITKEWLLKFKFDLIELADYINVDFTRWKKGEFVIDDSNNVDFEEITLSIGYELEYIHQLQNLYFALTGKELCVA
jgi:hypothetical protein